MAALNATDQLAVSYFSPPKDYFWRWTERGEVVEWQDGTTICYREELMQLLTALASDGLPQLGTVLLVLSACKSGWSDQSKALGILSGCAKSLEETPDTIPEEHIHKLVQHAADFLYIISRLPEEYRSGTKRALVLRASLGKSVSMPKNQVLSVLQAFSSGRLDGLITRTPQKKLDGKTFRADLECLKQALQVFPSSALLEQEIRTGVNFDSANPLEIPLPESESKTLLEQLSENSKTAGLANLTKRLLSFLQLPLHAQGSSDHAYGGISDISNRGNLDRLLLSELAHDDATLLARLANNESLYLRKEDLPANRNRERLILLDTTIRMWGTPRIFGMAAALACTQTNRFISNTRVVGLTGTTTLTLNLESEEGITKALEQLNPSSHCSESIRQLLNDSSLSTGSEIILITEEWFAHSNELSSLLSDSGYSIDYLIALSRKGSIKL